MPRPTVYPMSTQKKMQAVKHWDILANDVADQVAKFLDKNDAGMDQNTSIYVEPYPGIFGEAFSNMLITHLVQSDVKITKDASQEAILTIEAQLVKHGGNPMLGVLDERQFPGIYSVLATGIIVYRDISKHVLNALGIVTGSLMDVTPSKSSHEVIITTSILKDDHYRLRRTDLYYIKDPDWIHYPTEDVSEEAAALNGPTKEFPVSAN